MRISRAWVSVVIAGCCFIAGCGKQQNPDELRRETAQATSVVKQDAKAVVQGVRDGLKSNKPVDLNDASKTELLDLPGVSADRADKIIANRPFASTTELVSRHILTETDYDKIKDRVRVGKPSPSSKLVTRPSVRPHS